MEFACREMEGSHRNLDRDPWEPPKDCHGSIHLYLLYSIGLDLQIKDKNLYKKSKAYTNFFFLNSKVSLVFRLGFLN